MLHLLEGQRAATVAVHEDEPVGLVRGTVSGRLVTGPVGQAEELPVELGQAADVRGVEHGLQEPRMSVMPRR